MLNTAIIYPRILDTQQIGLLSWLIAISVIVSQFLNFCFPAVVSRLFPYFRDDSKKHNGFFFILSLIAFLGIILSVVIFFIMQKFPSVFFDSQAQKYFPYLVFLLPLFIFSLLFNLFEAYNRVMYDAISGTFFRDIVFKLINLIGLFLYAFQYISFFNFLIIYVFAYSVPAVLLFILMLRREIDD